PGRLPALRGGARRAARAARRQLLHRRLGADAGIRPGADAGARPGRGGDGAQDRRVLPGLAHPAGGRPLWRDRAPLAQGLAHGDQWTAVSDRGPGAWAEGGAVGPLWAAAAHDPWPWLSRGDLRARRTPPRRGWPSLRRAGPA